MSDAVLSKVDTRVVKSIAISRQDLGDYLFKYYSNLLLHADIACWNLFVFSAAAEPVCGLSVAAASGISRAVYSDTSAIVASTACVTASMVNT